MIEPSEEIRSVSDTSSKRIAEFLRRDIARGILLPGEHIRISELAQRYGTSHLPVREALRIVEGDRLIVNVPHKGATVRTIDAKFIENIYGLRTQIEVYLARRSVERINDRQLEEVVRRKEAFSKAAKGGDVHEMAACNRALHIAISEPADNIEAMRFLNSGWELVSALRCRFGYSAERLGEIGEEHDDIVHMMLKRNAEGAALLVRQHCESAERDLLGMMSRVGNNEIAPPASK